MMNGVKIMDVPKRASTSRSRARHRAFLTIHHYRRRRPGRTQRRGRARIATNVGAPDSAR